MMLLGKKTESLLEIYPEAIGPEFVDKISVVYSFPLLPLSPVRKLLGSLKLFCLDSQSHAPATGEAIRDCRMQLVSRLSLPNLSVIIVCYTFSYMKTKSIRNKSLKLGKQ